MIRTILRYPGRSYFREDPLGSENRAGTGGTDPAGGGRLGGTGSRTSLFSAGRKKVESDGGKHCFICHVRHRAMPRRRLQTRGIRIAQVPAGPASPRLRASFGMCEGGLL